MTQEVDKKSSCQNDPLSLAVFSIKNKFQTSLARFIENKFCCQPPNRGGLKLSVTL
jgi:hypothetical protein